MSRSTQTLQELNKTLSEDNEYAIQAKMNKYTNENQVNQQNLPKLSPPISDMMLFVILIDLQRC